MKTKSIEKINIYEIVTRKIIEQLEAGTVPWHKSWAGSEAINFVTRKPYQGINRLLLPFGGEWMTFKQAKDADGRIRKGEKSSMIVFFKWVEKKDIDRQDGEEVEYIPYLQYSNVFHISQCEGIESKLKPMVADIINHPIENAQRILDGYILSSAVKLRHIEGSNQAFYNPNEDSITMPAMNQFDASESYYNVVFHEMAHSTGHKNRLNRDISVAAFG